MNDQDQYAAEAKERWGDTEAYRQSAERTKSMTKADFERIANENDEIVRGIVANMSKGAASPEVQALIALHYEGLRAFYDPTVEIYRGLADMYAEDPRFAAHYDAYGEGTAAFMREAMRAFCEVISWSRL